MSTDTLILPGYYWVTKNSGETPIMLYLCQGKEYQRDGRSVEAWVCPGIERYRLDLQNFPHWKLEHIVPSFRKRIGTKKLV